MIPNKIAKTSRRKHILFIWKRLHRDLEKVWDSVMSPMCQNPVVNGNMNGYTTFYIAVQLVHIAIKSSQVCNRIKPKCFSTVSVQRITVQRVFQVLRSLQSVFRLSHGWDTPIPFNTSSCILPTLCTSKSV